MAGTRGTYGFASNQKVKLTYNHFDSFPEGLGVIIVDFCKRTTAENGWDKLRVAVDAVVMVDENTKMSEDEAKRYFPKKKSFPKMPTWYEALHSYQGGKILDAIANGEVGHMTEGGDFPKNSGFCDFCYIIDLNNMTLDVYIGKQKKADPNSYFGQEKTEDGWYPCKFLATWWLNDIPADWDKQIEKAMKEKKS